MEVLVLAGGENRLHAGLGIVEVAADGADADVGALLGGHLGLLNGGDAAVGVEHGDAGAGHVVEALHGRLAGVAGGGRQDDHVALHALGLGRRYDEAGQDAEGHILEGGGGAMVQLQHVFIRHGGQGRQVGRGELAGVAVADQPVHVLKVRQQGVEDIRRHGEGVLFQGSAPVEAQGRRVADVQAAVRGDALKHRVGGGSGELLVSCAVVDHGKKASEKTFEIGSCISDMAMIHCPHQKSKCFSPVDRKYFFVTHEKPCTQ